jgi:hypothetical protein
VALLECEGAAGQLPGGYLELGQVLSSLCRAPEWASNIQLCLLHYTNSRGSKLACSPCRPLSMYAHLVYAAAYCEGDWFIVALLKLKGEGLS